jgi:hypothetical protein
MTQPSGLGVGSRAVISTGDTDAPTLSTWYRHPDLMAIAAQRRSMSMPVGRAGTTLGLTAPQSLRLTAPPSSMASSNITSFIQPSPLTVPTARRVDAVMPSSRILTDRSIAHENSSGTRSGEFG